ncbi:MAG: polyprenyl synthetase family protein [Bacilli bacterium]
MSNIFSKYEKLNNDLKLVKEVIYQELNTEEVEFNKTIKKYFNGNAKLIRPAFVLIAASYKDDYKSKENIISAASAEMLHVATLIHDDIIDDAKLRRGVSTIHNDYDAGYAVICGDYLYAKSYQLLFRNASLSALKYVSEKVCNMAFGEVEQYIEKYNHELTIDKYLEITANKSAAFFQSNLIIGAKLAGISKDEEEVLADFGLNYGMMFQVQDDILDYINVTDSKPIKNDLKRGVFTLPLLMYMQENPEIKNYIIDENYDFVLKSIQESKAIPSSIDLYEMYYKNFKSILSKISSIKVVEYLNHVLDVTYRRVEW